MAYGTESDGRSADSQIYGVLEHPDYAAYRDGELSPIWAYSERLRQIIDRKGHPAGRDRQELVNAVVRQVPTLPLYREAIRIKAQKDRSCSLFVILFPGEAKDNTGIKDLNDKVLGYRLNSEYIECRNRAITELFWQEDYHLPPKFVTVGLDYKVAQVLAIGKTREDFAEQLTKLDGKLKDCLLPLLDEALKDAKDDAKRTKAINDLKKALKKKGYRFDFLYGVRAIDFAIHAPLEAAYLAITETLKGAAVARFMAKGDAAKTRPGKRIAGGFKPDPKKHDRRGKQYEFKSFLRLIKKSGEIKDMILGAPRWLNIWIDLVWTIVLYEYRRRVYVLNPDVVRDVRKKALAVPSRKQGLKSKRAVAEQRELLESWLVAVNGLDFVKDFLVAEFKRELPLYHKTALAAFDEVRRGIYASHPVDWPRLEKILTRDLRLGPAPISVQGRASEFMFYAYSSDHVAQIFFAMDIRDLGVQLALLYDWFIGAIEVQQPKGVALMMETFAASELIIERKRFTYDKVIDTFRKYFRLTGGAGAMQAARKAFGGAATKLAHPRSFQGSVQVMLGGDEIFVAAHPVYADFVCDIIAELHAITFKNQPLDMRVGVAYSLAPIRTDQKPANWESHDQALGRATSALNGLKSLERAHRRMQRLIEKLKANDKKRHLAPGYSKRLEALGLMNVFARSNHAMPQLLSADDFADLIRRLRNELYLWSKPDDPELVNFISCQVVDGKTLRSAIKTLEEELMEKVGRDNYYADPPPLPTKIPPLIKKILDWLLPEEKYPYDDKKKKKPQPSAPDRGVI